MSTKDFKEGMAAGAKPFGDKLDQLANWSNFFIGEELNFKHHFQKSVRRLWHLW